MPHRCPCSSRQFVEKNLILISSKSTPFNSQVFSNNNSQVWFCVLSNFIVYTSWKIVWFTLWWFSEIFWRIMMIFKYFKFESQIRGWVDVTGMCFSLFLIIKEVNSDAYRLCCGWTRITLFIINCRSRDWLDIACCVAC